MSSDRPVTVAMMRSREPPGTTAVALAHAALMQGARFFFFNPPDVDLANGTIDGLFYEGTSWQRRKTAFPDVIDNDVYAPPIPEVWDAMVRHCRMTTTGYGAKDAVHETLRSAGLLTDLLIPTGTAGSATAVAEWIAAHGRVVLKPVRGSRGEGIVYLEADGQGYRGNFDGRNWRIERDALPRLFDAKIGTRRFLVQRYVHCRTRQGLPCDIRVATRRGASGDWDHLRLVGRIGSGRTITSNTAGGGSCCLGRDLLRNRFGAARGDALHARLADIGRQFGPAFQALHPDISLDAVGLDIGVDESGRPWLFEINSFPADTFFEMQDAVPRMGYAIFLARNPNHPDAMVRA